MISLHCAFFFLLSKFILYKYLQLISFMHAKRIKTETAMDFSCVNAKE